MPPCIVNIQGDEPLIDPSAIDAAMLVRCSTMTAVDMGTLKKRIETRARSSTPNVVKVVTDLLGDAHLFFALSDSVRARRTHRGADLLQTHRAVCLPARFSARAIRILPVGPLEQAERLEQLRALENGYRIRVVETEYESLGVDTPADLERVSSAFQVTDH